MQVKDESLDSHSPPKLSFPTLPRKRIEGKASLFSNFQSQKLIPPIETRTPNLIFLICYSAPSRKNSLRHLQLVSTKK